MRVGIALAAALALSACLDGAAPDAENPTVQDEIASAISESDETSPDAVGEFFAFLNAKPSLENRTDADISVVSGGASIGQTGGESVALVSPASATLPAGKASPGPAKPNPTKGLFAFLRVEPEEAAVSSARAQSASVSSGTLPFGTVTVVCGLNRKQLGKVVDKSPRTGLAKWKLHDTNPTSTGLRTQYITGFADGCARQFTASLALFGSAGLHEAHRYGPAQKNVPYSATDKAYERIKLSVCGVGKGKPCPVARSKTLEKSASFVSIYQQFGGTAPWTQVLLYNGRVQATDTLSR